MEMQVPDILSEILSRLNVSREIQEKSVDSPDKIREAIQDSKQYEKESMWVVVGILQIVHKNSIKYQKKP